MIRPLFALLFAGSLVSAAVIGDSDFDGVDDARDACPATPFEAVVAADGCPAGEEGTPIVGVVGIGATYASGSYGGSEKVISLSNELLAALYTGNFSLSVLGAYYYRGAYDPVVATYDGGGLSDTLFSASYTLRSFGALTLTPGLHVKLATADSDIGTGQNDYGASLLAGITLAPLELFALGGYTVTGNSADTAYRDIIFGSLGAGLRPNPRSYLSLSYDYAQAYETDVEDLHSLSLYGVYDLYDTLSLKLGYSYGLSDSAADHSLSLMLTTRF